MGKKKKKKSKIITSYYDIESAEREESLFFFLEHLLKARIDLHMETGENVYEEEVNMYLADLLHSVLSSRFDMASKPYLSPFDIDVRNYINAHPGLRNEYVVYKENADFGLVYDSVFLGFNHEGSYHDRVMPEEDIRPRVAQYYLLAASALGHLRGMHETLVQVLYTLAQQVKEIAVIIRKAAGDYFDFIERLTTGSFYHLQKNILSALEKNSYREKVDTFLRLFKEYKSQATQEIKQQILDIVIEIKKINPGFEFNEAML